MSSNALPERSASLRCKFGLHDFRLFPPADIRERMEKAGKESWCDWYSGRGTPSRECIRCGKGG